MIKYTNISILLLITTMITNCKPKVVIDSSNEEIGVIDESDKIFREVKELSSICLGDYMKCATLLDKEVGKVTDESIKQYADLFEDNAEVYADIFEEPEMINNSDYATYTFLFLENEGIDCRFLSYTFDENKFKVKKYQGGDFYRTTWIVQKGIKNGLDEKKKPIRYNKERILNLSFVFYVYLDENPKLSKAQIMYINPIKED